MKTSKASLIVSYIFLVLAVFFYAISIAITSSIFKASVENAGEVFSLLIESLFIFCIYLILTVFVILFNLISLLTSIHYLYKLGNKKVVSYIPFIGSLAIYVGVIVYFLIIVIL